MCKIQTLTCCFIPWLSLVNCYLFFPFRPLLSVHCPLWFWFFFFFPLCIYCPSYWFHRGKKLFCQSDVTCFLDLLPWSLSVPRSLQKITFLSLPVCVFYLLRKVAFSGKGWETGHIVEASFVLLYILNIFMAAFLLVSDSELLEVLYAYIVKSLGWKNF